MRWRDRDWPARSAGPRRWSAAQLAVARRGCAPGNETVEKRVFREINSPADQISDYKSMPMTEKAIR